MHSICSIISSLTELITITALETMMILNALNALTPLSVVLRSLARKPACYHAQASRFTKHANNTHRNHHSQQHHNVHQHDHKTQVHSLLFAACYISSKGHMRARDAMHRDARKAKLEKNAESPHARCTLAIISCAKPMHEQFQVYKFKWSSGK